jgi:hypothetical protein
MKPGADNECRRLVWLLMQRDAHRRAAGELGRGNAVNALFAAGLSARDRVLLERFDRLANERANEILSAAWAYSGDALGGRVH